MADSEAKPTVMIVDDHPLFRQGVADALSLAAGFKIVGQADNGRLALELLREVRPAIAVMDIKLPEMNGLQVTRLVSQEHLPTRIILLTGYHDDEQVIHAAWSGARGYCAKDVDPDFLIRAVDEVIQGRYVILDQVMERCEFDAWLDHKMAQARHLYSQPGSPFHPLSEREMEVLARIVAGLSNKEIAAQLHISHQTVKNHITSILRKFCVEDRTQAAVYALKHGWVQVPEDKTVRQE